MCYQSNVIWFPFFLYLLVFYNFRKIYLNRRISNHVYFMARSPWICYLKWRRELLIHLWLIAFLYFQRFLMLMLMTLWNFYIFNLVFNWFVAQTNFIEWIQLIWIIYVVNSFKFIFFQFKSIFQGSLRFLSSFIIMMWLNAWTLDLMICIFIILFIFLFFSFLLLRAGCKSFFWVLKSILY